MKLDEIELTNFRSHADTKIKDLKRVNVFLGLNAAGKSTVIDSIVYGLTGVCRGLTLSGAGADGLIRRAERAKTFSVKLSNGKGPILRGLGDGPKSRAQARIEGMTGQEPEMLRALLNPTSFLSLKPGEQRNLIQSVASEGLTDEEVLEIVGEDLLPALEGWDKSIDGLDQIEKDLRGARPEIKRRLAEIVIPEVDGDGDPTKAIDEAEECISGIRAERDKILTEHASHAADVSNAQRRAEAIREKLAHISEIKEQGSVKEIKSSIKKLSERLKELVERDSDRAEKEIRFRSDINLIDAELEKLRNKNERLTGLRGTCPTCDREMTTALRNKMVKATKDTAKKEIAKRARLEKKLDGLQDDLEQASERERLEGQIAQLEKSLAVMEGNSENDKELREELKKVEAMADAKVPPADVSGLETEIAEGEEFIAKQRKVAGAMVDAENARNQLANEQARLDNYDAIIKIIGPKGELRARMMQKGGISELETEISEISVHLGLEKISFGFEKGFAIFSGTIPAALLSTSEQYRLSLAIAAVLAKRSGAGILCLDGAEIIDTTWRGAVNEVLEKAGLDQAFMAATVEGIPEGATSDDEWAIYSVTKEGSVSKVQRV